MYCTIDDLLKQSSEEFLIRCTDDENTGDINPDIIAEKIEDAQTEIDAYCRAQYAVPFTTVPGLIKKLCVDIALYNLISRRGLDEDSPDAILVKRYRDAVKLLENLAKGLVTIGAGTDLSSAPLVQQAIIQSSKRHFTRNKMRGF